MCPVELSNNRGSALAKQTRHFNVLLMCAALWSGSLSGRAVGEEPHVVKPTLQLAAPMVRDQDDMCVWVHPKQPELSLVICSDKSANSLFVYDLDGKLLQDIPVTKPGNIDIRQVVKIDGQNMDLIVVNQRSDGFKLCVFKVKTETRQLTRLDESKVVTGPNYGGCLYHSARSGRLYFVCTSETGTVEQHELKGNGKGGIVGEKIRSWPVGKCEGAVADDAVGTVFISEETKGVWKFDAEPDKPAKGELIIKIGEHGLQGDVEGLAIYRNTGNTGYLIVSDQGRDHYKVYQRETPHAFVGDFAIVGAKQTDGIELVASSLGPAFPQGLFACHTDVAPRGVLLTPWHEILSKLKAQPNTR